MSDVFTPKSVFHNLEDPFSTNPLEQEEEEQEEEQAPPRTLEDEAHALGLKSVFLGDGPSVDNDTDLTEDPLAFDFDLTEEEERVVETPLPSGYAPTQKDTSFDFDLVEDEETLPEASIVEERYLKSIEEDKRLSERIPFLQLEAPNGRTEEEVEQLLNDSRLSDGEREALAQLEILDIDAKEYLKQGLSLVQTEERLGLARQEFMNALFASLKESGLEPDEIKSTVFKTLTSLEILSELNPQSFSSKELVKELQSLEEEGSLFGSGETSELFSLDLTRPKHPVIRYNPEGKAEEQIEKGEEEAGLLNFLLNYRPYMFNSATVSMHPGYSLNDIGDMTVGAYEGVQTGLIKSVKAFGDFFLEIPTGVPLGGPLGSSKLTPNMERNQERKDAENIAKYGEKYPNLYTKIDFYATQKAKAMREEKILELKENGYSDKEIEQYWEDNLDGFNYTYAIPFSDVEVTLFEKSLSGGRFEILETPYLESGTARVVETITEYAGPGTLFFKGFKALGTGQKLFKGSASLFGRDAASSTIVKYGNRIDNALGFGAAHTLIADASTPNIMNGVAEAFPHVMDTPVIGSLVDMLVIEPDDYLFTVKAKQFSEAALLGLGIEQVMGLFSSSRFYASSSRDLKLREMLKNTPHPEGKALTIHRSGRVFKDLETLDEKLQITSSGKSKSQVAGGDSYLQKYRNWLENETYFSNYFSAKDDVANVAFGGTYKFVKNKAIRVDDFVEEWIGKQYDPSNINYQRILQASDFKERAKVFTEIFSQPKNFYKLKPETQQILLNGKNPFTKSGNKRKRIPITQDDFLRLQYSTHEGAYKLVFDSRDFGFAAKAAETLKGLSDDALRSNLPPEFFKAPKGTNAPLSVAQAFEVPDEAVNFILQNRKDFIKPVEERIALRRATHPDEAAADLTAELNQIIPEANKTAQQGFNITPSTWEQLTGWFWANPETMISPLRRTWAQQIGSANLASFKAGKALGVRPSPKGLAKEAKARKRRGLGKLPENNIPFGELNPKLMDVPYISLTANFMGRRLRGLAVGIDEQMLRSVHVPAPIGSGIERNLPLPNVRPFAAIHSEIHSLGPRMGEIIGDYFAARRSLAIYKHDLSRKANNVRKTPFTATPEEVVRTENLIKNVENAFEESGWLNKISKELDEFGEAMLTYLRFSGMITKADQQAMREGLFGEVFTPLYRVAEDLTSLDIGTLVKGTKDKRRLGSKKVLKAFKGDPDKAIAPFVENWTKYVTSLMTAADLNSYKLQLLNEIMQLQNKGLKRNLVEEVSLSGLAKKHDLSTKTILEALKTAEHGGEFSPSANLTIEELLSPKNLDKLPETLSFFSVKRTPLVIETGALGEPHMLLEFVRDQGKTRVFLIKDPALVNEIVSYAPPQLFSDVLKKQRGAASWLWNKFTTVEKASGQLVTKTPEFGLVINPIRDSLAASVFSPFGFVPILSTVKGLGKTIPENLFYGDAALLSEMAANRMGFSTFITNIQRADVTSVKFEGKLSKRIQTKEGRDAALDLTKTLKKFFPAAWDGYGRLIESFELASRAGEYMLARKAGVPEYGAAVLARDVGVDFGYTGSSPFIRTLTQGGAFVKAMINGINKMSRAAADMPVKTAMMGILGLGVGLNLTTHILGSEFEEYGTKLTQFQKDYFYNVPNPEDMDEFMEWMMAGAPRDRLPALDPDLPFIGIPKPLDVGQFGTVITGIYDSLRTGGRDEIWQAALLRAFMNVSPFTEEGFEFGILPTAGMNFARGVDRFGNPILPEHLKDARLPDQRKDSTSQTASKISAELVDISDGTVQVSPAKVQFLMDSLVIGLLGYAHEIAEAQVSRDSEITPSASLKANQRVITVPEAGDPEFGVFEESVEVFRQNVLAAFVRRSATGDSLGAQYIQDVYKIKDKVDEFLAANDDYVEKLKSNPEKAQANKNMEEAFFKSKTAAELFEVDQKTMHDLEEMSLTIREITDGFAKATDSMNYIDKMTDEEARATFRDPNMSRYEISLAKAEERRKILGDYMVKLINFHQAISETQIQLKNHEEVPLLEFLESDVVPYGTPNPILDWLYTLVESSPTARTVKDAAEEVESIFKEE